MGWKSLGIGFPSGCGLIAVPAAGYCWGEKKEIPGTGELTWFMVDKDSLGKLGPTLVHLSLRKVNLWELFGFSVPTTTSVFKKIQFSLFCGEPYVRDEDNTNVC